MSNQIITVGKNELSQEDVQTLKNTIAKDLNESQFKLFLAMCHRTGANPIVNEIHPSVFKGQMTVQFGYDFYIRKAKETEGYLGYDVQLIHENDDFKVARKVDEQGRSYMAVEKHEVTFPRGKVIGGYAVAYRKNVTPFMVLMEVSEVEHLKKSNIGMQKTMWTNYFEDMFKKHILKRALKSQFGLEFDDQTIETSTTNEFERERKDITPHQEVIEHKPQQQSTEQEQPDDREQHLRDEINKRFRKLFTTKEEIAEWMKVNAPNINPKTATEQEMLGLIELLDMNIELMESNAQEANDSDEDSLE